MVPMEWSATSATKAYLDTLKLRRRFDSSKTREPGSNEFISALAAGMNSKLIVEVTYGVSTSTEALAAAARQTGGRLVCILPEPILAESKKAIKDSRLKDMVEFRAGDPSKLLPNYEKIDFFLVDCRNDESMSLLKLLDVNPTRSVVVANNLVGEKKWLGGHIRRLKNEVLVRSVKHPIGKGMEVTMIREFSDVEKRDHGGGSSVPHKITSNAKRKTASSSSKWIFEVDAASGEEHIYRVPNFV